MALSPSAVRLLLALLAAVLLPGPPPAAQTSVRLYQSNELGMPLREILPFRQDEVAYVLRVERGEGREVRILYHDGEEQRRWEREGGQEKEYREGVLVEAERRDAAGRLVERSTYSEGELSSRTVYSYGPGGLRSARTYDAAGKLAYTDSYTLGPGGELRAVRRTRGDGTVERAAATESGGRLLVERSSLGGQALVNRYDRQGRRIVREVWDGGTLQERETYRYREGEGEAVIAASQLQDAVTGRRTLRSYDEQGRLVLEEVYQGEAVVEETRRSWDEEGREVATIRRGPEGLEQWRNFYGEDGKRVRQEYYRRGALEKVTLFGEEKLTTEEFYRDGRPFLRVTTRDGEKLKEEFLRDGAVVGTREYR